MRWYWNHATDDVWRQLDPVLWELTHNPWAVLQTVSRDRIEALSGVSAFRKRIDDRARARFAGARPAESGRFAADFNMAYLAIRGSGAVNAVSRLHGEVSRHLFAPLFPLWPVAAVPVAHVTNGVHMPTLDSAAADEI